MHTPPSSPLHSTPSASPAPILHSSTLALFAPLSSLSLGPKYPPSPLPPPPPFQIPLAPPPASLTPAGKLVIVGGGVGYHVLPAVRIGGRTSPGASP